MTSSPQQQFYTQLISEQSKEIQASLARYDLLKFDSIIPILTTEEKEFLVLGSCSSNYPDFNVNAFFKSLIERAKEQNRPNKKLQLQNKYELLLSKLSVRALNIIRRNELLDISSIMPWLFGEKDDFLSLENCGIKTNQELKSMIKKMKSLIIESDSDTTYPKTPQQYYAQLVNRQSTDIKVALRSYGLLQLENIVPLINTEEKSFLFYGYLSPNNYDFRPLDFFRNLIDRAKNHIPKEDAFLQKEFENYRLRLSVRALNILKKHNLINILSLRPWLSGEQKSFLSIGYCGVKTNQELLDMIDWLKRARTKVESKKNTPESDLIIQQLNEIGFTINDLNLSKKAETVLSLNYIDELVQLSPWISGHNKDFLSLKKIDRDTNEELQHAVHSLRNTKKGIPLLLFLNTSEYYYVDAFNRAHGHLPMFYIMVKYFVSSKKIKDETIKDIWKSFNGYTSERLPWALVEKKLKEFFKKEKENYICKHKEWGQYTFYNEEYCHIPILISELKKEGLSKYHIPLVLLLGKHVCYVNYPKYHISFHYSEGLQATFIIDNKYKNYKFIVLFREIERLTKTKRDHDIYIPVIVSYVNNPDYYWDTGAIENINKSKLYKLIRHFFKQLGVVVNEDNIVLEANHINIAEAAYNVLKSKGEQMYITDIASELRSKFSIDISRSYLASYLSKDERIAPIGKSSYWCLKEWEMATESIREIAVKYVKRIRTPIKIEKLVKLILKDRPDASENSISSIIRSCTLNRELLLFYGDEIGYPGKSYVANYNIMPQTFNDYINAYWAFVLNNKRHPSATDGFEGYLYRWHYRSSQLVDLDPDEIVQLDKLDNELKLYPQNGTEYNFLQRCNQYKKFVEANMRLVEKDDMEDLFRWFETCKTKYNTYNDNKKLYFESLLKFITSKIY